MVPTEDASARKREIEEKLKQVRALLAALPAATVRER